MDRFALVMGLLMVILTWYVAFASHPPIAQALVHTLAPEHVDAFTVITLVGGTVGGYITFAGAHRLLDAGLSGPAALRDVTASASTAIGVASIMRIALFLAALGVVAHGAALDPGNPAASVFRLATGEAGYRTFGVVMWAAAITSVVGSAYTSVSFLRSLADGIERRWTHVVIAFIVISTAIFLVVGQPVRVLVLVGSLNGLILPLSLGAMLVAANRRDIVGEYRHPLALTIGGSAVVAAMAAMSGWTVVHELPKLFR